MAKKFKKGLKETSELDMFDELFPSDSLEDEEKQEQVEEEDEFKPNGIVMVVDRVEHGLVGSLLIEDDTTNLPIFKKNDIVHFKAPARLLKKDFVLYLSHDEYFIRRIIKFVDNDIYVAGDNEKAYHIIHKEEVIGKAIGRQRKKKFLSLSLNPTNKFYTFKKVNLAKMRLGNRVLDYEADMNSSTFENAMLNSETNLQTNNKPQKVVYSTEGYDLDSVLASFLNPDDLVRELRGGQAQQEQVYEESTDEEVEYVEEEVVEEVQEQEQPEPEEELEIALSDDDI